MEELMGFGRFGFCRRFGWRTGLKLGVGARSPAILCGFQV